MRRGIARFQWLPAFALAAWGASCLLPFSWDTHSGGRRPAPDAVAASVSWRDGYRQIEGLTLTSSGVIAWRSRRNPRIQFQVIDPELASQGVPGGTLVACTLVGDWRGRSLIGTNLRACNLSGALLDETIRCTESPQPIDPLPSVDLSGATYDRATRRPQGFDPLAHGARLVE